MGNLKYNFKFAISDELLDGISQNKFYLKEQLIGFTQIGSELRIIARFICMNSEYLHTAKMIGWKSLLQRSLVVKILESIIRSELVTFLDGQGILNGE